MTLLLDTPFVDVRGDALRWTLDPVARTPLASRDVDLDLEIGVSVRVSLRVLGASHQVVVYQRHRDDAVTTIASETVACDLVGASPMPRRWHRRRGYAFSSTTENLDPAAFTDRIGALLADLDDHPYALAAHFPGHPDAVTALALEPRRDRLAWRTWHGYPQTGELVRTDTDLCPTENREIMDV